jgi:hypothetical protein
MMPSGRSSPGIATRCRQPRGPSTGCCRRHRDAANPAAPPRAALERADAVARATGIPALVAEADRAARAFAAPAARLTAGDGTRLLGLADVEALIASETLVVDACRSVVRAGATAVSLAGALSFKMPAVRSGHRPPRFPPCRSLPCEAACARTPCCGSVPATGRLASG